MSEDIFEILKMGFLLLAENEKASRKLLEEIRNELEEISKELKRLER